MTKYNNISDYNFDKYNQGEKNCSSSQSSEHDQNISKYIPTYPENIANGSRSTKNLLLDATKKYPKE